MITQKNNREIRHARSVVIEWEFPEPKNALDRFIGPGATKAEILLQFGVPVLFAAVFGGMALSLSWGWTPLQIIGAVILALDIVGGVITNATGAAKRWYHRSGQSRRKHLAFVGIHAIQLGAFALLFPGMALTGFSITYGYLWLASVVMLSVPLYLQRPVSLICLAGGLGLGLYAVNVPVQLEWFIPLFYAKIFVSHLLYEEPYRPTPS